MLWLILSSIWCLCILGNYLWLMNLNKGSSDNGRDTVQFWAYCLTGLLGLLLLTLVEFGIWLDRRN